MGVVLPAWAGVSSVGTFAKSTSVGAQTIAHGLGTPPRLIVFWTAGQAANGAAAEGVAFLMGATDGSTGRSVSMGLASGTFSQQAFTALSAKAVVLIQPTGALRASADVTSWDASNFTLQWGANDASGDLIHFLALGGGDVQAKVVDWTFPTAVGNRSVTGVGFRPDAILHFYPGSDFTAALGTAVANGSLGVGASGVPVGAGTISTEIMNGGTPTAQLTQSEAGTGLLALGISPNRKTKEANLVSMDVDGFTLDFTTADATAGQLFSVALGGFEVFGDAFPKPTGPPNDEAVTGAGFSPSVVLLIGNDFAETGAPISAAKFFLGIADASHSASAGFAMLTASPPPIYAAGLDCNSHVACIPDDSGDAIEIIADLTSFDPDGFSLHWATSKYNNPDTYSTLLLRPTQSCGNCEAADAGVDGGAPDGGVATDGGTQPAGDDGGTAGGLGRGHGRLDVAWACEAAGGGVSMLALWLLVGIRLARRRTVR